METLFAVAMGLGLLGQTSGNVEKKSVQVVFVAPNSVFEQKPVYLNASLCSQIKNFVLVLIVSHISYIEDGFSRP